MNHVVRRVAWDKAFEAEKNLEDDAKFTGPSYARFVHVDQSYNGAEQRVMQGYSHLAPLLRSCRWAIINVWRPIDYPVTRDTLAMCDARSIPEEHLVGVTAHIPKDRRAYVQNKENHDPQAEEAEWKDRDAYKTQPPGSFEVWQSKPPEWDGQHRWFYVSEMRPDEALLLKIFDSKKNGVARRNPHTSFTANEDYGPDRHSLEARCLVFWEDQPVD